MLRPGPARPALLKHQVVLPTPHIACCPTTHRQAVPGLPRPRAVRRSFYSFFLLSLSSNQLCEDSPSTRPDRHPVAISNLSPASGPRYASASCQRPPKRPLYVISFWSTLPATSLFRCPLFAPAGGRACSDGPGSAPDQAEGCFGGRATRRHPDLCCSLLPRDGPHTLQLTVSPSHHDRRLIGTLRCRTSPGDPYRPSSSDRFHTPSRPFVLTDGISIDCIRFAPFLLAPTILWPSHELGL